MLKLNMATIYYPYFGKLLDGSYNAHDVQLTWNYVTPPDKLFRNWRYRTDSGTDTYTLVGGFVDGKWIIHSNLVARSK